MNDIGQTIEGVSVFSIAIASHVWAIAYPVVTGISAVLGLILAAHGVYNLIRRRPVPPPPPLPSQNS